MATKSSNFYRDVQVKLRRYYLGIPMSSLSCLERSYYQKFKISLYNNLDVKNVEELLYKMRDRGMVLFYEEPKSKMPYVMCAHLVKFRRDDLKHKVQALINDRGGSIPLVDFEVSYKHKFTEKLDYHFFCLKDLDTLCIVLNLIVEAADSGELVIKTVNNLRNMPMKSSNVYQEIQKILGNYFRGIPEYLFSRLEEEYEYACKRSLDYNSLGVTNMEELLYKMRDVGMVVFSEEPESKKTYVMCLRTLKIRQEKLQLIVQELLDENDGEIPLIYFERLYENKFKLPLDYHFFGLKDFDSLCKVLNLAVVEAANSPGGQVVKKAGKIYNLRKRKK